MTEYDYSPDAYERHLATQQRIARWTEDISKYRPSNPFLTSPTDERSPPSSTSRSSTPYGTSPSPDPDYAQTGHRSTSNVSHHRIEPSRSYTAPTLVQRSSADYSSRSHSTHRSGRSSRSVASHHSRDSSRSRATASTFKTVTPNPDRPTRVQRSKSQAIVVPIEGGGYVIIPPKGTRLEVTDQSSYVETRRQRERKSEKPLLKRLFSV